ncbi:peptide-methionine (S)-S-oxide reductase [Photobacterium lutimaris]|uniref:Peptide methionine sulfoxide reductase MsrA n=1 Tax=Photobacterium lutimaris TaxID=388278 RepID=A0A2T3J4P1_9GAMM|nr:peptide-methionine (S)-S-oxide reductase [Photobacterium lutimaris]PSU36272.1 methionine sulfoxide reductase A [Photobacterium lutimaris]TDR74845.1 peptide-methionine (S)-S-oxide reductase [Photobacterium lutimaris]
MEKIYFAGGCLWGVQEFMKHLPGVTFTEAGRANGTTHTTQSDYDGYAECVLIQFDAEVVTIKQLMAFFFEIIDPYSINKQGADVGPKYRTGVYSQNPSHLVQVREYLDTQKDKERIAVEVMPLSNYVKSDEEHQDRLTRYPNDYCHIPLDLLHKYKQAD